MAAEIDESGFYRQDFSAASNWEIFTAQLGDVFQKWFSNIDSDDCVDNVSRCGWDVQTETLLLLKEKISISYYTTSKLKAKKNSTRNRANNSIYIDLMAVESTFGPPLISTNSKSAHTISCVYGLQRFVLIHPHLSQKRFLSNPSHICFYLSAAAIVSAEYCPMIPIFLQMHDTKLSKFLGIGMHFMQRTNFDIVTLKQSPIECLHLSGLLTIFKDKLPANCVYPITISVRKTYALKLVRKRISMSLPFYKFLCENDEFLNTNKFIALPCGYFPDAYTELYLVYGWLDVSENGAIDSPLHSDFVPSKSPSCILQQVAKAASYLANCLRDFVKLYSDKDALETFVGHSLTESSSGVARSPQQITDPHFRRFCLNHDSNLSEVSHFLKVFKTAGPLNESELKDFLAYLFPDLYPDVAKYSYSNDQKDTKEFDMHRIKSAVMDSLSCRLVCLLATCNAHYGGKSGLAQLWAAFTRELRFIWDTRLSMQGVAAGFPNTRTCLLNQKLQMLNYCIEHYKFRKYGNIEESKSDMSYYMNFDEHKRDDNSFGEASGETGDEGEDEFYDCTDYPPEGRDKCLGEMKLLDYDEPLYIPITQDPVPKTEDEAEADAESMLKLGADSGLSMHMCSSLISDMEAFKAANPKGRMEDFIRWYSPRDWEEDDKLRVGRLSARMQAPGNTWQTVWQQAQPVPASKQKRLFDETTEAIKVLTFLETRNINEIYELTIIPLLHAAIIKFKDILETAEVYDIFETEVEALLAGLCHLSWNVEMFGQHDSHVELKTSSPERLIEKLEELEAQFYQYKCFEQILDYPDSISLAEVKRNFQEMMKNEKSCNISSANILCKYIGASSESAMTGPNLDAELHDKLIIKEYVLRVRGEMAVGPQFLRAIVKGEELRLCGAFTENTVLV